MDGVYWSATDTSETWHLIPYHDEFNYIRILVKIWYKKSDMVNNRQIFIYKEVKKPQGLNYTPMPWRCRGEWLHNYTRTADISIRWKWVADFSPGCFSTLKIGCWEGPEPQMLKLTGPAHSLVTSLTDIPSSNSIYMYMWCNLYTFLWNNAQQYILLKFSV